MIPDLRYYLAIFFRRIHYFLLVFFVVVAIAGTAAIKLPPVYEASAGLMLQSGQIPDSLAAPTIDTAALEQMQVIEQRLMTRANLLEIARKLDVFAKTDNLTPDEIVGGMAENTTIRTNAGQDQATVMLIAFEAGTAETAAAVVNEYVTRILSEDAASRTAKASDTLQFFQQEVDRLSEELSAQSAKILAFQNQNADALPSSLDYRQTQQTALQERLATIERDIADLKQQKQRLIEIFQATGQITGAPTSSVVTPEAQLLATLRNELSEALAVYSAENPKVKMLQSRIEQLEATVRAQVPVPEETAPARPMSMLDIQTTELDTRITQLQQQHEDVTKQLAVLKTSIDKTAGNAIALAELQRNYDNIQAQYNTATDRLSKASAGERIQALAKGQRITVLDSVTVPSSPIKPHRTKIVLAGILGGLALGLGLIALLEFLNPSVRRPIELERKLGITPIGAIPYIHTPGDRWRRRIMFATLILLVLLGLPAMIWAIDTFYLPIDQIL